MSNVTTILTRLEDKGYRLTGPRRKVLEEVLNRSAPFTSTELWDTVQKNYPTIGRATLFRTLDLLSSLGIVQRIHKDADNGLCHEYMVCGERHHHHLICTNCGIVRDFTEDKSLETLVKEVEKRTSFQINDHRLELAGLCPRCQPTSKARQEPDHDDD